jgi:hypothetical protein
MRNCTSVSLLTFDITKIQIRGSERTVYMQEIEATPVKTCK